MLTLAIHDGHTASVVLMKDGKFVYAIQEERLVNEKNIGGFPDHSLADLLQRQSLTLEDIDRFVFAGTTPFRSDSLISRQAVLKKYAGFFSQKPGIIGNDLSSKIRPFIPSFVLEYKNKLSQKNKSLRKDHLINLGVPSDKITLYDHHQCHAAAAGYGWDRQDRFVVVTLDSSGDGISGTVNIFENNQINRLTEIKIGDSIARIYSLITYYMGMVPMEHEYKLMGMAPYSEGSEQAREIADYFHGLFELNKDGLSYQRKSGVEPVREMGPRLSRYLPFKRFDHICAGLQLFIEEFAASWIQNILKTLQCPYLALSGGLFMNVKLNKRIMELEEVKDMFVFPSCGDESNVFGAAYLDYVQQNGKQPAPISDYCLGGEFSNEEIEQALSTFSYKNCSVGYSKHQDIEAEVARLIAAKEVVARFHGRMEFGARALGNRSILAHPGDPDAVRTINKMIKNRDFWMPFAPSMVDSSRYIINSKGIKAPYMIMTFDTVPEKIKAMTGAVQPYDGTCRPQEVYEEWNPSYYRIIREFEKITGESVILNTSLNLHGYPLVYSPNDSLNVFDNSGLKYLAIGSYLVVKQ